MAITVGVEVIKTDMTTTKTEMMNTYNVFIYKTF